MRGATCFSGIGAPECAAPWLDWRWCAEIEPFPAAVHSYRFPGAVNLGDVLAPDFLARAEPVDVLVGGPPCQSFSIAGLRGGLADPRGNLTLRWVQVIHAVRPRYAVTENVPGWLSSNDNAFGCFLAGLVGADDPVRTPDGRSWPDAGMAAGPLGRAAWRVLDAQHFGVPQRRRRVFVVWCPPDGGDPAAVLFERQGVHRHPSAGQAAGEGVARPLAAGTRSSGGYRHDADTAENLIAPTFNAAFGRKLGLDNQHIDNGGGFFVPTAYRVTGNDGAYSTGDAVGALGTMTDPTSHVLVQGEDSAGQIERDAVAILRALRIAVGEEAFAEWGLGVFDTLRSPEILRAAVHGGGVRRTRKPKLGPLNVEISCAEAGAPRPLRNVREAERAGCPSSRRQPSEQLSRELGSYLSKLPSARAPQETFLRHMRQAAEGNELLLKALPAVQEAWRSARGEGQPAFPCRGVRRITPTEAERLQGFPDGWTDIVHRGRPAADGSRYKAIGNSMAVPVLGWLLDRVRADALRPRTAA